jgi:beta-xylosidase
MRTLYFFLLFSLLVFSGIKMAAQSTENSFQNPLISTNFPDPFILKEGETYYAYSTNSNSRNVPSATSTDLVNWDMGRDVMPSLASWVDLNIRNIWAPEIIKVGEEYLLFYTARDKTSDKQCLGLAISDSPTGQFFDRSDSPFICQAEEGGSIDASPFRDEDGKLYLYWKNDGNCCMMPTYLYVQELSEDGKSLLGEAVRLIRNEQAWHGSVVEAPTMWKHEGQYYLFYSANSYAGEAYAVGYANCESPLGPCTDAEENPILASDMESLPLVVGPGHQTIIQDNSGQTWLVYHVWQVSGGRRTDIRQMWLDKLDWVDGRPVVLGPTREEQAAPIISMED